MFKDKNIIVYSVDVNCTKNYWVNLWFEIAYVLIKYVNKCEL